MVANLPRCRVLPVRVVLNLLCDICTLSHLVCMQGTLTEIAVLMVCVSPTCHPFFIECSGMYRRENHSCGVRVYSAHTLPMRCTSMSANLRVRKFSHDGSLTVVDPTKDFTGGPTKVWFKPQRNESCFKYRKDPSTNLSSSVPNKCISTISCVIMVLTVCCLKYQILQSISPFVVFGRMQQ